MLVLLHSVEAVRKLYIAKQLTIALNSLDKWKIDDYTVDFTADPYEVFDADGTMVFKPNSDTNSLLFDLNRPGVIRDYGMKLHDRIVDFYENVFLQTNKDHHIKNAFGDLDLTLGLSENDNVLGNYDDIVKLYENKPYEHVVLSGMFSKASVEKLRELIGTDVVVLNVVRNPSSAYIADDSHLEKSKIVENFTGDFGIWLFQSLISAIQLQELNYTTTVKYEDIIVNQSITFDSIKVDLPEYTSYNGIISVHDHEEIIPQVPDTKIANLTIVNTILADSASEGDRNISDQIPANFFAALGYEPLDYATITGPKT